MDKMLQYWMRINKTFCIIFADFVQSHWLYRLQNSDQLIWQCFIEWNFFWMKLNSWVKIECWKIQIPVTGYLKRQFQKFKTHYKIIKLIINNVWALTSHFIDTDRLVSAHIYIAENTLWNEMKLFSFFKIFYFWLTILHHAWVLEIWSGLHGTFTTSSVLDVCTIYRGLIFWRKTSK